MNPVEIVVLGTAASAPTKERNLSAIAIRTEGNWLLFDCPEGAQQQMLRGGVSYMKIEHIFLTHLHLDHVLGLPGLLATMQMHARVHPLFIYCPQGWKNKLSKIISLAPKTDYDIVIREITRGEVHKTPEFRVSAIPVKHEIECVGYVFEQFGKTGEFQRAKAIELGIPQGPLWSQLAAGKRVKHAGKTILPETVLDYSKSKKGVKIAYVVDTIPAKSYFNAISEADILFHEATFMETDLERARDTMHSTAKQAGEVAAQTNAKRLILTHFSGRHAENERTENEARMAFGNVSMAHDLEKIVLKAGA